ncbi:MAG: arginase family protein [Desulfotomaculales bacterium]
MRVGILQVDDTYEWQSRLLSVAEYQLLLPAAGLRYMATRETLEAIAERLANLPAELVFLGGGDLHHLAVPLIGRHARRGPLTVVVFDRHPDAFPAPEGFVSCGSWLREAARLSTVRRILVLGAAGEGYTLPPKTGVVTPQAWRYWFSRAPNHFEGLLPTENLYLSIDKDVFSELSTGWGAGEVPVALGLTFLRWVLHRRRVVGADVCGEVKPRGAWPTLAELRSLAACERVNLALCRLLGPYGGHLPRRQKKTGPTRAIGPPDGKNYPAIQLQ